MNELISIIIPVKNGHKYIREAVAGIRKQNMDVEIIVVDDGSDDDTANIAGELGCKVVRHEVNKGPVVAKNSGLKAATGSFVMFHDHDDIMRDGALQTLYNSFDENTDAVEAKVVDFYSPELTEAERRQSVIKTEPFYGLFTGAILIRKSAFDKIGLFPENMRAGEMLDWEHKMKQNGLTIKKIDLVSTDRRIHTTNFGKTDQQTEYKDYAAVLRARLMKK
ncbi:MAG: glycosyltransferase family 2 protein [Bacteroidales bacterium]|nr:glycosyltransferase family 2 protein [Bacteroidales bacterium]